MKRNYKLQIGMFLALLFFVSCKKEIKSNDYETKIEPFFAVGHNNTYAWDIFNRPGGGFIVAGYTTSGSISNGIGVSILDQNGRLINFTNFGGTAKENFWDAIMDQDGNVYMVGSTNSNELKMDVFKDAENTYDAYIAKVDKNGKLLWQRAYTDTISGVKGRFNDEFYSVHLLNNELICTGYTGNYYQGQNNYEEGEAFIVKFDLDGNFVKQTVFDTPYPPTGYFGFRTYSSVLMENNDLLLRYTLPKLLGSGAAPDTSSMIIRYDLINEKVIWKKFYTYDNSSVDGDIFTIGELADGNILGINSLFNYVSIFNGSNGELIESYSTELYDDFDVGKNSYVCREKMVKVDNELYALGYYDDDISISHADEGGYVQLDNSRPLFMKFNQNGKLLKSKIYTELHNSVFNSLIKKNDGNLQMLGNIYRFDTKEPTIFLLTMDKDGEIVKKK